MQDFEGTVWCKLRLDFLEARDEALKAELHAAEALLAKNGAQVEQRLAKKLARIAGDEERSVLADSQRIEIVALKTQVDTLKDQLAFARNGRFETAGAE